MNEVNPIPTANIPTISEPDCDCISYKIYNTSKTANIDITYIDCITNNATTITASPESWTSICACQTPGISPNHFTIVSLGNCN